jgi:CspA family cold shock protein
VSIFEGILDHGEDKGWGLWLDPAVAEDPIWREHWAGMESLVVKLAEDRIVLEAGGGPTARAEAESTAGPSSTVGTGAEEGFDSRDETPRELGRVKWFDPDKGYGFLAHPNGPDVFVHHSEVLGDQGGLEPGAEVEYEVGRNDRGLLARGVRLLG